eukprot:1161141-Pelagomonas_calceolata.AAC.2
MAIIATGIHHRLLRTAQPLALQSHQRHRGAASREAWLRQALKGEDEVICCTQSSQPVAMHPRQWHQTIRVKHACSGKEEATGNPNQWTARIREHLARCKCKQW